MNTSSNSWMVDVRRAGLGSRAVAGALVACVLTLGACTSDDSNSGLDVQAESFETAPSDTGAAQIEAGGEDDNATVEVDVGQSNPDAPASPAETAAAVGPILNNTGQELAGAELEEYLARRYEAYWYAFNIARQAPSADPSTDYPVLYNLAAGEQLNQAYAELDDLFTNGRAIREPDVPAIEGLDENSSFRVRIETLEEGVAELVSCLVNDQVTYDIADGSVVSDSVRTVQTRATMAKAEGTWKLIRSQAADLEAGVAGCWLEEESAYPY